MARIRNVGFNFFKVCTRNGQGEAVFLNLTGLLDYIRNEYRDQEDDETEKIVYEYKGEPARLTGIQVDEHGFYHIWFERLFNFQLPIKTTLHGESEVIEIEEAEFVGHEVNVMYDPFEHVIMIQRNRDSLGPAAIEELIHSLVVESEIADNAFFAVIFDQEARARGFRQRAYRRIQMQVTGTTADDLLTRLWGENADDVGVESIEIIMSTGRGRDSEIELQKSREILERFVDNRDTQKLRIRGRQEDDSLVEPTDLLNQKLEAFTEFNYNEERNFNPYSVYERMKELYMNEEGGVRNVIQRMR